MKTLLTLVLLTWVAFVLNAQAKDHPFDEAFERELRTLFFDENTIAPAKLLSHEKRLNLKKTEISGVLRNEFEARGKDDIEKEIKKHKFVVALNIALEKIEHLKQSTDYATSLHLAFEILDIEESLKSEGDGNPLTMLLDQARKFLRRWKIKKNAKPSEEASNLFFNGEYLSTDDRKNFSGDLSLLDPAPGSSFWQKPKSISTTNMKDAARGRTVNLYDGIKPHFPDDNVFYYDEVKHSDTKPKIDAYAYTASGKKKKFKLKFGAELHSDPTISALTLALGFPTDLTKFERNIRLVLGKKITLSDITRDWELYYRRDAGLKKYNIEKYILESGVDADGNNFIVFNQGLVEAKPSELERLGGWDFKDVGRSSMREVRGLTIVQMWLNNTDIKEFANNRQILKENDNGEFTRHHIISDLGYGFGNLIFPEYPELYPTKMIYATSRDSITLNYRTAHALGVQHNLTLADARWATRLIAALTREQLADAVKIGGWPKCVANLYVEKMISRRNDLVKHFNLLDVSDHDGNPISFLPHSIDPAILNYEQACNNAEIAQDFTTNFDFGLDYFTRPLGHGIVHSLMDLARSSIGSVNSVNITAAEIGFDSTVISQVLINIKRTVEKNPTPTSEKDIFIVQDHFEVGMRLGYSFGIFADSIYKRGFTLSYPARSMDEARSQNGHIVNALLPLNLSKGKLPESYVLMTEHHFESGVGIELDSPGHMVSPTLRAKRSKVLLLRSFLDHRDSKNYLVYRDRTKYDSFTLQMLLRIIVVKLPVMDTVNNWGTTVGAGSRIPEGVAQEESISRSIHDAVINGRFSALKDQEDTFRVTNHFRTRSTGWNLFLFRGRNQSRLERIELNDSAAGRQWEVLQYMTETDRSHSILGNSEKSEVSVEILHHPNRLIENFQLNLNVEGQDSNTTDREMEQNYLRYVNGLSISGAPLVPITPSLGYTSNGRWGKIITLSRSTIYPEGLSSILAASESDFWNALAQSSGISTKELMELRGSEEDKSEASTLIRKAEQFWRSLKRAQNSKTIQDRMVKIANAFRGAAYRTKGFVEPRILGALHRIAGAANVYSFNTIGAPDFEEHSIMNEAPLYGTMGTPRDDDFDYMLYNPKTPTELYFLFDHWK